MWKCRSISPGSIVLPDRSTCRAPSGARILSRGPDGGFGSLSAMRAVSVAFALMVFAASAARAQPAVAVRAWQGELQLPSTIEGAANPNPPFDPFALGRFNYPYPLRDALTGE